jgi:hypothetical protein
MGKRRHEQQAREIDPETGKSQLALTNPERARSEIATQTNLAIRTAEAMRKLVLVGENKTQVATLPAGKVDPMIQLVLLARDEYEQSEGKDRLGYFRAMIDLFTVADQKSTTSLKGMADALERDADRKQREKHHREKLEFEREKRDGEPSDDQLKTIAYDQPKVG